MSPAWRSLLGASPKPLVLVGSAKNAGKTVTLNRLRAEAQQAGLTGFGLLSAGWDGEESDHLSGTRKPRVDLYEGDLVVTSGPLFASAGARCEILYSHSLRGRLGRLAVGRCLRAGAIEIAGPPSVAELGDFVERLLALGARRVLIDGAADRRTPLAAFPEVSVGLAFVPERGEDEESFVGRVVATVARYRLDAASCAPPLDLPGESIAWRTEEGWRPDALESLDAHLREGRAPSASVFVAGPLSEASLGRLAELKTAEVIVQDPSRLFASASALTAARNRGTRVTYARKPDLAFVSLRLDGGVRRALRPHATLAILRAALPPELPCFDPWLIEREAPLAGGAPC